MSRRDALIFHNLVSVEEAIEILYRAFLDLGYPRIREIDIADSLGKILAEDVYSRKDYPPFDRSIVDGYAVRSVDIAGANELEPIALSVIGKIEVGELPTIELKEKSAVEISTGAIIPRGADSVVMSEYTKRVGDKVYILRGTYPGENISQTGSDISIGDLVIRRGTVITPRELAVLIASGIKRVKIYEPLKISVFSTGTELAYPGEELAPGKIYDINGLTIVALLKELGLEASYNGILRDDYKLIYDSISSALEKNDVVITSGGTSAGYRDLVYRVFRDLGGEILFHGLRTKPGKPTVVAKVNNKLLIGLPGFPFSAVMILLRVVKPAILRIYGLDERRDIIKARIPYRIEAGKGLREFIPVALVEREDHVIAYPLMLGSGSVMNLVLSEGFIEVPENREYIEENETIDVILISGKIQVPEIYFIGSHCLGVDLLLDFAGLKNSKRIFIGSLGGWYAVKRGDADIAGTHLLDEESGEYNLHMINKMNLGGRVYVVRGYARRIGFVVKKNNPKNIKGFKDLLREDIVFINRNKGSGIRTYTDMMLKELIGEEDPAKYIKGYTYEAKTHTAVAAAVEMGRADVGIAIEAVVDLYKDLDFIPLTEEIYDFVIPRDRFGKRSVQKVLDTLRSDVFKIELERRLRGYRSLKETGNIIYKPE
ncbi:MAG: molybdopterin biosynthesis protein [Sulfolobales archaeon]